MSLVATLCIFIMFECVHYGEPVDASCPAGFVLYSSKCYKAISQQASWPEAKEYCAVLGGDLASVSDVAEQAIIKDIIAKNSGSEYRFWIDGMRIVFDNEWRWMKTNGQSVPFQYTSWFPGQPENLGERCVAAYGDSNGLWHDHFCEHLLNSICSANPRLTFSSI